MSEKPILFSAPMVRAILDGCKTMTRRVIKLPGEPNSVGWGYPVKIDHNGTEYPGEECYAVWGEDWHVKCKYAPGDLLWVRETWSDFHGDFIYRADEDMVSDTFRWKPSIHMPREAARLFLEVTDVRVERLQDITEEDAMREGLVATGILPPIGLMKKAGALSHFVTLWDSLYARRGCGWDENPWVSVIEFRIRRVK